MEDLVKHRKKKKILKFLEIEQLQQLEKPLYERAKKALETQTNNKIELSTVRDFALLSLLYGCALRISEATNLMLHNLNMKDKYLIVIDSKGNDRVVDIPEPVIKILNEWLAIRPNWKNNNYVFCNVKKSPSSKEPKPIARQHYNRLIKNLAQKTQIFLEGGSELQYPHPHTIRHSRAMNLRDNKVELDIIQKILGHSDLRTTQVYAEARREEIRKAQNNYTAGIMNI